MIITTQYPSKFPAKVGLLTNFPNLLFCSRFKAFLKFFAGDLYSLTDVCCSKFAACLLPEIFTKNMVYWKY